MGRPGMIPPGRGGLIMLAAALVPLAVVRHRHLVRTAGRKLQRWGRSLERMAQEAKPVVTEAPSAVSESTVSEPKKATQSRPKRKK